MDKNKYGFNATLPKMRGKGAVCLPSSGKCDKV